MNKLFKTSITTTVFTAFMLLISMSSFTTQTNVVVTPPKTYPIEGLWIGYYTVNGDESNTQQYFSFIIKPDGTMINDTKGGETQHLAPGTWSLTGNVLSCTFTCVYGLPGNVGITETTSATWDKAGKLTGIWKNVPPLTGSGTITLKRVN